MMVTEVSSNIELPVLQDESFQSSETQEIVKIVSEIIRQYVRSDLVQLDAGRIENVISYLIDQVEAIQGAEQLFLLSRKTGQNEAVKKVLFRYKDLPKGFITNCTLSECLSGAIYQNNVDLIDYFLSEFKDRIMLDSIDGIDMIDSLARNGDEHNAIKVLLLCTELDTIDLKDILDIAYTYNMEELALEAQEILDRLAS